MPTTTNAQTTCPICKKAIWAKQMVIVEIENYYIAICPQCFGYIGHCSSCDYGRVCNFKNDHSEPQMVQRQTRRGMSILSMPMKNPHLIDKHCKICRCAYETGGEEPMCQRDEDNGTNCGRYKIMPEILNLGTKIN